MKKVFMNIFCSAFSLTCFSAYAVEIKPFVGGNFALNTVVYADDINHMTNDMGVDLSETFLGVGGEIGVKFETDRVYSAAITFAYDYMFNSKADINALANPYISLVETGFSAWGITYDNYLRVSGKNLHRQDVVLGIGLWSANERFKMNFTDLGKTCYGSNITDDDDGTVIVFKIGYNYAITKHVDLYLNGRWFIPIESDSDIDGLFNMNAGLRYLF